MFRNYCEIMQTAGGVMYIFYDMRIYRKLFNANSGILMELPRMDTAG